MTEAEISRRLALAIGYDPRDVHVNHVDRVFVWRKLNPFQYERVGWYAFDYRDPAVIWPIAERFNCFPQANLFDSGWHAITQDGWENGEDQSIGDTAAKAVALAVIKAHEEKK
jgi:hypothetical protein